MTLNDTHLSRIKRMRESARERQEEDRSPFLILTEILSVDRPRTLDPLYPLDMLHTLYAILERVSTSRAPGTTLNARAFAEITDVPSRRR